MRSACAADAAAIAAIYNPYVLDSVITFEETPVSVAAMADRISDTLAAGLPWLVAERDGQLQGYAYAAKWRARSAYRYALESSVYLAPTAKRLGLGSELYRCLLARLREIGCHTVIGGIALPNTASVALHEKLGYRRVARFEQVGYKFERWIDVGYWQLHLDVGPQD
ncbi:N-acetyltransferase [Chitinimonas arctica]|uniref:N-acetyltransferase n=1 Tax=Chitinimonas arctica TaxID=2594795 RepID=A0A516SMH3_9NEIS|nr:N-acetyltransferase [Chitinimonas arctica]